MTEQAQRDICLFGEVLFDQFPDGSRVMGGAPFNVAWHLQAFGQAPYFVSRVGRDTEGAEVRDAMQRWGMSTAGLQSDDKLPTGQVSVSLEDGEPQYSIIEDCAYDAIEAPPMSRCGLLYHGSLAIRSERSAATLQQLRATGPDRVFVDVNLRAPWWRRQPLLDLIQGAQWVKLNVDELVALGDPDCPAREAAHHFLEQHHLQGLVVTHAEAGAELITADGEQLSVQPESGVKVVDTVGAGDAFTSVVIVGLLAQWPLSITLRRAQQFASRIVGHRGATVSNRGFYREVMQNWELEN